MFRGAMSVCVKMVRKVSEMPQNLKWLLGGPKQVDGVWKGVYLKVFGRSRQLSQNKFFDPSTPSVRKVDNREKKEKKKVVYSGHLHRCQLTA